ncbi:MAG: hypothetical protein AAGD22_17100 [Verrucomicrobiota bacterium]
MRSKIHTIVLALLFLFLLAPSADANIAISIDLNNGDVMVSGSYVLLDATGGRGGIDPLIPANDGNWRFLTDGAGSTLSPTVGNSNPVPRLFPVGSVSWNSTDTSNSNSILFRMM